MDITHSLHPFFVHRLDVGRQILEDIDVPWGHQVAVMFQVVCALALEVPEVLLKLRCLNGVSPNVVLTCEPWGHIDHCNKGGECLSSDSTGAYVHELSLASCDVLPVSGEPPYVVSTTPTRVPNVHGVDLMRNRGSELPGAGHPCSVPFVSHRPGASGRLLLAAYVQWQTGLLVASDCCDPL